MSGGSVKNDPAYPVYLTGGQARAVWLVRLVFSAPRKGPALQADAKR
ncbi:MAG: hypothetical protein II912_03755 [Clostridia bacterium]|nr:hypothetical protein [Clostridia bacterium]